MIAVAILPDWPVPPQQATPNFLGRYSLSQLPVGPLTSAFDPKQALSKGLRTESAISGHRRRAVRIIPIGPGFKGL